jgi:hypothetical protein
MQDINVFTMKNFGLSVCSARFALTDRCFKASWVKGQELKKAGQDEPASRSIIALSVSIAVF